VFPAFVRFERKTPRVTANEGGTRIDAARECWTYLVPPMRKMRRRVKRGRTEAKAA